MNEDIEVEGGINSDFMTVRDLEYVGKSTWPHNKTAWMDDTIAGIVNGKVVDFTKIKYVRAEGYPTNGTFFLMDNSDASAAEYEK